MQVGGWVRAWASVGYLLGALTAAVVTVLTLPLLGQPGFRQVWAGWHGQRAGRVRGVAVTPHQVPVRRYLCWVAVHVATAVPFGLVTVLCVGNILLAAVVVPLWWAFPAGDPPRLLVEIAPTGWGSALVLGLVQIAVLAALGYRVSRCWPTSTRGPAWRCWRRRRRRSSPSGSRC